MAMKLLVGRKLSDAEEDELRSILGAGVLCVANEREDVVALIADAEAYVPGPLGEDVFAAASQLRWVHFLWAGMDGVRSTALLSSDVTVTNSAGAFAVPMAEQAVAVILAFSRGLNVCMRRPWEWREMRTELWGQQQELPGLTLGVLGYGGIGRAAAQRAKAFGMRILAIRSAGQDTDGVAESIWGPDRLDDLLAQSDYLLISCPLTPQTRGLIGRRELALMKPHAVLINLARGAIVDQPALVEALQEGRIGGAGLDVTTPEPLPADSPLWKMENVIITPHTSAHSPHTWECQFALLRENVSRYVRGQKLLNVVNKQTGY
jgi:phosphoglycerate dehydrogenase-like enzyme